MTGHERDTNVAERIERIEQRLRSWSLPDGSATPQASLQTLMERYDVPGVSVAVVDRGRIEWARGYGLRDAERGAPVEINTRFQAASISKPVSALAALRLVEEGRLDLDADINDYLTSWRVPANGGWQPKVTLRQILSHSAGLTVHGFPGYRRDHPIPTLRQILDGAPPANTAPIRVDTLPGAQFRYSGGGYTVLHQLLTDVTGMPFPELMKALVLNPAGMADSDYAQPAPGEPADAVSRGHRTGGGLVAGGWHIYPELAAASLWTTPSDLCRLAIELQRTLAGQGSAILSGEMLRRMLEPQTELQMGLGFFLEGEGASARFGHTGGNEGFRCELVAYREGGFAAAVMTNSDDGPLVYKPLLNTIAAEYGWPGYLQEDKQQISLDAAALARYEGSYELRPGYRVAISRRGDRLALELPAQAPVELLPESGTDWYTPALTTTLRFVMSDSAVGGLVFQQNGGELPAKRVE